MGVGEPTSVWAVLKRWLGPIPRWPYWLAGAAVVAVGQLIANFELLKSVDRFAKAALRQVGEFSPFTLASTFLGRLETCSDVFDIKGEYVRTVCRLTSTKPGDAIGALYRTVRDLLDHPNVAAMLILLVALVAGFLVVLWLISAMLFPNGDGGPVQILLAAVAAPFVGSGIAFVLQLVGIVFFTIFGAVIGLLIWIATQLVVVLAVFKAGRAVQENAALLKQIDDRLRPPPP